MEPGKNSESNDSQRHNQNEISDAITISQASLATLITEIVAKAIQTEKDNKPSCSSKVFQNIPPNDNESLYVHAESFDSLNKIPDIVKNLKEFSGKQCEFLPWKKSVDRVLLVYRQFVNSYRYSSILSAIRNKIVGNADLMLETNNVALNWEDITNALTLYYGDKRDIGTLEYQLTRMYQKDKSLIEFYESIHTHLSLMMDKVAGMGLSQEGLSVLTDNYRNRALDVFIRGLKGDLPRLLSIRNPKTLPEALDCCIKLESQSTRPGRFNDNNNTYYRVYRQPTTYIDRFQANSNSNRQGYQSNFSKRRSSSRPNNFTCENFSHAENRGTMQNAFPRTNNPNRSFRRNTTNNRRQESRNFHINTPVDESPRFASATRRELYS